MLLIGTFQAAALLNVAQANLKDAFKSLNDGKQTKWNQPAKKVAICRGSLAWLGRQTHNLENINGGQTPMSRSRGLEARKKRESRSRHHLFLMLMLFVWNFVNKY